jgi:hypothetical protein
MCRSMSWPWGPRRSYTCVSIAWRHLLINWPPTSRTTLHKNMLNWTGIKDGGNFIATSLRSRSLWAVRD